jgi:hypothetical protein
MAAKRQRRTTTKTKTGGGRTVQRAALLCVAALVVVALADLLVRAQVRNDIVDIAYSSRKVHKELIDQRNINGKLLSRLSQLQSPQYVKTKLLEQGIVLSQPEMERIVWLKMPKVPEELLEQEQQTQPAPAETQRSSLLVSHSPVQP